MGQLWHDRAWIRGKKNLGMTVEVTDRVSEETEVNETGEEKSEF